MPLSPEDRTSTDLVTSPEQILPPSPSPPSALQQPDWNTTSCVYTGVVCHDMHLSPGQTHLVHAGALEHHPESRLTQIHWFMPPFASDPANLVSVLHTSPSAINQVAHVDMAAMWSWSLLAHLDTESEETPEPEEVD